MRIHVLIIQAKRDLTDSKVNKVIYLWPGLRNLKPSARPECASSHGRWFPWSHCGSFHSTLASRCKTSVAQLSQRIWLHLRAPRGGR